MDNKENMTGGIIIKNFFWRFAERWGAQGVNFIVSIILARLLMPQDYGIIAIVMAVISILDVFVDSGLASALIQKKEADELDFSSAFYFNIVFCVILYVGLFFLAPFWGNLYEYKELSSVLRVLGLIIIISGVKNTQMSYVSRNMQFKRFFFATFGGTIVSAIVGIRMAMLGFGVWAIVFQYLVNALFDTIILWVTVKWRPRKMFSFQRLCRLLSFGWKILASNLIGKIYSNIQTFVIGTQYTSTDLGLYNKGMSFPVFLMESINSSINSVLLPALATVQDDIMVLKKMTRRSIRLSTYVLAPMMLGLFSVASPLITVLLTEKWLPCVPYLRIFCVIYLLYPIQSINMNAIFAKGRSDIYLKLEIAKKIMGIVFLLITVRIGVIAVAYSLLLVNVISILINAVINIRILDYSIGEQIADFIPNVLISILMGTCIQFVHLLGFTSFATLLVQVIVGFAIYVIVSALMKNDSFIFCKEIIVGFVNRHKLK